MGPQTGHPAAGQRPSLPARVAAGDYRRLLARLASRAKWLGSQDPEGAAQEALKRSLENARSQPAVKYYFSEDLPADLQPPEWPLDQLFAWLHGVLCFVVREEHHRAAYQREMPIGATRWERSDEDSRLDPADPAPDQLDALIQKEIEGIVADCFPRLDRDYRTVLRMRVDGLKYGEIAIRLGVNESTVATWITRGIKDLAQCVRRRTQPFTSPPRGAAQ